MHTFRSTNNFLKLHKDEKYFMPNSRIFGTYFNLIIKNSSILTTAVTKQINPEPAI